MIKRTISPIALLFTSVSAILGSGWLFAAFYTSTIAGPSSIVSWLIGGILITIIAFVYAELSAMIPITGSTTRIPQFTHGNIVGFIFSWLIWLSFLALVPTEVQAILQYLNFIIPGIIQDNGGLTRYGYYWATGLMLFVSAINILSTRWLIRCNNIITVIKIAIPLIVSFVLILFHFLKDHSISISHGNFFPYGAHGIYSAIATGGIIFAFNGFKQAAELAGESKRPKTALPFAIIGSIVVCLIVYIILQYAFLSSISSANLIHGWHDLTFKSKLSPFAAITHQQNIHGLTFLILVGAIIAPFAAALMYAGSAARSLYGKSKNGYLPELFSVLSINNNPIYAILLNFLVGMFLFAPLPGWNKMTSFLTALMAISYVIAPIGLISFRNQVPDQPRPFKLPFGKIWSTIAFYVCTLLIYWTGWDIISKLCVAILIGIAILFIYHFTSERGRKIKFHWRESIWVWPYFIGISIISYLGNYGHGLKVIPLDWDFVTIAIFCLIIVTLAQRYKLPGQVTKKYIDELQI